MDVGGASPSAPSMFRRRGGEVHERRGVLVNGHVVAPGNDRLDGGEELGVDGIGLDSRPSNDSQTQASFTHEPVVSL